MPTEWVPGLVLVGVLWIGCGGDRPAAPPAAPESENQEAAAGVVVPDSIPDDFPRHPSMRVTDLDNESYDEGLVARFESDATLADLRAFYEREFPARGWSIAVAREIDDRLIFFADKKGLEVDLEIFKETPHRIEMVLYAPDEEDE